MPGTFRTGSLNATCGKNVVGTELASGRGRVSPSRTAGAAVGSLSDRPPPEITRKLWVAVTGAPLTGRAVASTVYVPAAAGVNGAEST